MYAVMQYVIEVGLIHWLKDLINLQLLVQHESRVLADQLVIQFIQVAKTQSTIKSSRVLTDYQLCNANTDDGYVMVGVELAQIN